MGTLHRETDRDRRIDAERRMKKVCRVILVGVRGNRDTKRVQKMLASVGGLEQEFSPCPPSLCERVRLPIVRAEADSSYYGVDAIQSFVRNQLSVR